ncbi:hypothetical protein OXX69_013303, partial [Metschnikowia pulcherrima]
NRDVAQQIEARFSSDMDLEDVMIMAKFCAGERHNDRSSPDTTPMRDYVCMPETPN